MRGLPPGGLGTRSWNDRSREFVFYCFSRRSSEHGVCYIPIVSDLSFLTIFALLRSLQGIQAPLLSL